MTIGTGEMFGLTQPENFPPALFRKEPVGVLAPVAYYAGRVVRGLQVLSAVSDQRVFRKLGRSARKKLGQRYRQIAQTLIPLFAVWLCNGVWHGTGWTYLFYGMYYFVLIVAGELIEPVRGLRNRKTGH